MAFGDNNNSVGSSSNANASAVLETLLMDAADVRKNINSGRFKLSSKTDSESDVWKVFAHRRGNRGWWGPGPPDIFV